MIQQLSSVSNVLPVCGVESCSNEDRKTLRGNVRLISFITSTGLVSIYSADSGSYISVTRHRIAYRVAVFCLHVIFNAMLRRSGILNRNNNV